MCSFSFPVVFILVFGHWTPNRPRTLPGKSPLSVLEATRVDTQFRGGMSILFFEFFGERLASPTRRDPPEKYCSAGLVGADWLFVLLRVFR
jgi:hypothetical protein